MQETKDILLDVSALLLDIVERLDRLDAQRNQQTPVKKKGREYGLKRPFIHKHNPEYNALMIDAFCGAGGVFDQLSNSNQQAHVKKKGINLMRKIHAQKRGKPIKNKSVQNKKRLFEHENQKNIIKNNGKTVLNHRVSDKKANEKKVTMLCAKGDNVVRKR